MKQLTAFMKKEYMEMSRSYKLLITMLVFFLVGVLNPGTALITPTLFNMMSEEMEKAGLVLEQYTVTAYDSWGQFYKNMPMVVIFFILMFSGILTNELQKGTLINILTKGLQRWKVMAAKSITLVLIWIAGVYLCFGTTYAYTIYYWDNSMVTNLGISTFLILVGGIWLISLIMLMSSFTSSGSGVILGTGLIYFACYLASMISKIEKYLPTRVMDAQVLVLSGATMSDFTAALIIAILLTITNFAAAIVIFNRKAF